MKENKYDDGAFFIKYSRMPRSIQGLEGAGEWHSLKNMLPDFVGKRVLDLGCGFGWHCVYAAEQGAASVVGVDISEKMLAEAREKTKHRNVSYIRVSIEDYEYPENSFDAVISSLTFHYIKSFDDICAKVNRCLADGGDFVFSVEHPIFTAQGKQDWVYDESGTILHWPVDSYFSEGERIARFLDEDVTKYHKTLTTYIECLLRYGFEITGLREPTPTKELLAVPGMSDELRRPMMLIISAKKK
jgi:ubiquinone/menaquinone biosynthesis C-methylase UbiE